MPYNGPWGSLEDSIQRAKELRELIFPKEKPMEQIKGPVYGEQPGLNGQQIKRMNDGTYVWESNTTPGGSQVGYGEVKPMGCVCPGDATPYCKNPMCPRKNPCAKENFNETPTYTVRNAFLVD